jgi:hypothetical protein
MVREDPFDIAKDLEKIVDGVQASERRIVVAFAPDEKHVEKFPQDMYDEIMSVIDNTYYQEEYRNPDRGTVELHKWGGGRSHSPVLRSSEQPAGYELQMSFVQ